MHLRVSNQIAVPGQPIIVSGTLEGCAKLPTTFSLALFHDLGAEPFATITKSSSSFKYYKSGSTFFMNWIYRGPNGDGAEPGFVGAYVIAEGGCPIVSNDFGDSYVGWEVMSGQSTTIPSIPNIFLTSTMTSLKVSWSDPGNVLSRDVYYQVQYCVSGTARWSHSLNTRDTSLVLADLRPLTSYQVRVRSVNNAGASKWGESPASDVWRFSTAGYSVKSFDSNGEVTSTFSSGDTVTIKMHLTNCSFAPIHNNDPDPTREGTISYTIFPIVNGYGDGFHAISGLVDNPISGPTGTYDANEHTYDVILPLNGLADGTYTLLTYFFATGCSYDYALPIVPPRGETISFTVGQDIREIPQLPSLATVTKISPTSATLAWNPPANLKDGPFTYTVDILTDDGSMGETFHGPILHLGSTQNTSLSISGLQSGQIYVARITVSNLVSTSQNAPYRYVPLHMPDLVRVGGSKITLATLLKSLGLK